MSFPVNMAAYMQGFIVAVFALFPFLISGETCLQPKYKSDVYTTSESTVSELTVFVVEFTLTCKNNIQNLNLYAEINGQVIPASRVQGTNKYQVSLSGEHKKLPAGRYPVRIFDEEGYGDLRKAQRSGDDTAAIKSLFTMDVSHPGAFQGPVLSSSIVASLLSLFIVYFAYSAKQGLVQS